jgi:ribokinase
MKPVVVVVGSLNMDFAVRTQRLPLPGETVPDSRFRMTPGGKGANQAVAAARLGAASLSVRMVGRVGQDLFADHLKASLAGAGVDVSSVHASRANPTGVALIAVDSTGQNSIVVAAGANADLAAADVEAMRRVLKGARIAMFQLETPLATVEAALKLAREEGVTTILDPAPAQALPPKILENVDILTPNEVEFGHFDLAELGAHTVVRKMGARGCTAYRAGESIHIPAFAVDADDTTAAGDVFNAGLAVALAEGSPFPHALRFANAAAAISVTRPGAQTSVPTRAEVDALLTTGSFQKAPLQ